MASFSTSSPVFSFIIFSLVVFAPPVKSYPLDNICKQTKNPNFCFNLLKPHSNESLQQIEQAVIDATFSSVAATSGKIQSLLSKTTDPNLRLVYGLCSNYYSASQSVLTSAKEKLKSHEYSYLKFAARIVSRDASLCQKAFAKAPSQTIPIANDNNNVDLLSSIFVVVSGILSPTV